MGKCMEWVNMCGRMDLCTVAIICSVKGMAKASMFLLMENITMVNGQKADSMVMENYSVNKDKYYSKAHGNKVSLLQLDVNYDNYFN